MLVRASAARSRSDDGTVPAPDVGRVQPFLKWAGGKRQLLPALRSFYPPSFGAYFEPFLGSGAVFFDLASSGALDGKRVLLSDTNCDIIGCYLAIRRRVSAVTDELRALAAAHERSGTEHYYAIRDRQFNPRREQVLSRAPRADGVPSYPPALAAMLIYLNRTGYNGLFRVNQQGRFNVPVGRYKRPRICDATNLGLVAATLAAPGVDLRVDSYEKVVRRARSGDFVYLDPPYAPVSPTARFTAYTARGFGEDDQVRLQEVVVRLARRGCHVLLSNSDAPSVATLYAERAEARAAGLRAHRVPARRAINSKGTRPCGMDAGGVVFWV
jgi:DNA adenine methylase